MKGLGPAIAEHFYLSERCRQRLLEMTRRGVCRGIGEAVKNGCRANEGKVNFPQCQPYAVGPVDDIHKSQ